jgi:hypothetical protein
MSIAAVRVAMSEHFTTSVHGSVGPILQFDVDNFQEDK